MLYFDIGYNKSVLIVNIYLYSLFRIIPHYLIAVHSQYYTHICAILLLLIYLCCFSLYAPKTHDVILRHHQHHYKNTVKKTNQNIHKPNLKNSSQF